MPDCARSSTDMSHESAAVSYSTQFHKSYVLLMFYTPFRTGWNALQLLRIDLGRSISKCICTSTIAEKRNHIHVNYCLAIPHRMLFRATERVCTLAVPSLHRHSSSPSSTSKLTPITPATLHSPPSQRTIPHSASTHTAPAVPIRHFQT